MRANMRAKWANLSTGEKLKFLGLLIGIIWGITAVVTIVLDLILHSDYARIPAIGTLGLLCFAFIILAKDCAGTPGGGKVLAKALSKIFGGISLGFLFVALFGFVLDHFDAQAQLGELSTLEEVLPLIIFVISGFWTLFFIGWGVLDIFYQLANKEAKG